jgi:hypothetical protein
MTEAVLFVLQSDVSTLRRTTTGSIVGSINVHIGAFSFPEPGWSDFVVRILAWWLERLHQLAQGYSSVDLMFMGGPYQMRVTRIDQASYSLEFMERYQEGASTEHSVRIDISQMEKEVRRVAASLVEACRARKWQSADIDSLAMLLSRPHIRYQ